MLLTLGSVLLGLLGLLMVLWVRQRRSRLYRMMAHFPGPRPLPLLGNTLQLGTTTVEFTNFIERNCKLYFGKPFAVWVGDSVYIILTNPKDIEIILGSNKLLDKGDVYQYFLPWLGTGLLTSTGTKWRTHRKILTPTFHFSILEAFVDVFNANGDVLVGQMRREAGGAGFDLHKYATLCALDNISQSAMGVEINAQQDSSSEYVRAIRNMADVLMKRSLKPWYGNEFIFNCTKYKKIQEESLKVLHRTTNSVIKRRKAEILKARSSSDVTKIEGDDVNRSDGKKKRLAFLDMLIESTLDGSQFTDEDIREEVDTFMFEGHDTTSSGISFAGWLLSRHPEIQDQVFQELEEVFPDPKAPLTFRGLQELKCMERVIKESLRMYPSVPLFVRQMTEDVELSGGLVAPKDAMVTIAAMMTHRNPDVFPDPDRFDPDRFLPDNVQGRHPYAYIPFSAGPRNCIGQKFAMLEMKATLAHMLRAYKLLPAAEEPNLVLSAELILVSTSGISVKIVSRRK